MIKILATCAGITLAAAVHAAKLPNIQHLPHKMLSDLPKHPCPAHHQLLTAPTELEDHTVLLQVFCGDEEASNGYLAIHYSAAKGFPVIVDPEKVPDDPPDTVPMDVTK
jgi:hypothetical protein